MKLCYFLLFVSVIFFGACQNTTKQSASPHRTSKQISFTKEGQLSIMDSLGQPKAQFDIEFARDDYERETGLMYRKTMKDNQAMLFIFQDEQPRYFWMKNTYMPLDIIYINTGKKIVSIAKNAQPMDETSLPSRLPAQYVLEIKAGLSDDYALQKGDKVSWKTIIQN